MAQKTGAAGAEETSSMKTETQTKQDRIESQNGYRQERFWFEPVPVEVMERVIRTRSREQFFRHQNAILNYVLPVNGHGGSDDPEELTAETAGSSPNGRESFEAPSVNGHNASGQPASLDNDDQAESKPLVVNRHGQDNLSVDYFKMWTIWR